MEVGHKPSLTQEYLLLTTQLYSFYLRNFLILSYRCVVSHSVLYGGTIIYSTPAYWWTFRFFPTFCCYQKKKNCCREFACIDGMSHVCVSSGYIFQSEIPDIVFDGYRKIALRLALLIFFFFFFALLIFILPEVLDANPCFSSPHRGSLNILASSE